MQPCFDPFPTLPTERLILREIILDDLAEMHFLQSDSAVLQYLDTKPSTSLDTTLTKMGRIKEEQRNNSCIEWAICLKEDPSKLLGVVTYWRIMTAHFRAEIGYRLNPSAQGKGLMTEALQAVIEYGKSFLKLHSIEANINPDNAASIRLLQRLGFVKEGHFRENYYFDGRFVDSAIYSLVFSNQ